MYRNLLVRLRGLPKPSSEDSTIAELRRILQRQQGELTELQAEVSRLRGTGDGPTNGRIAAAVRHERSPGPIDRRALLGKAAGVVAAGAGIALVGAQPAFAGSDGDVVLGSTNNVAGNAATQIFSSASFAFGGYNNSSSPGGIGVSGASLGGPGVMASSYDANGLHAETGSNSNPFNAVYAHSRGTGNAVFGEMTANDNTGNALLGINRGPGNCVFGYKPSGVAGDAVVGVTNTGRAIYGIGNAGRGGVFSGAKAQVRLTPSTASTHPSSGQIGDLFVDSAKRLWFCKGTTSWSQII